MFVVAFVVSLTISLCARHALGRSLLFHLGHDDGEATCVVTVATMEQQQQQQQAAAAAVAGPQQPSPFSKSKRRLIRELRRFMITIVLWYDDA